MSASSIQWVSAGASVAFALLCAAPASASCPPPSRSPVPDDGTCVLASDATLATTLELAPDTTLDCGNHRLLPVHAPTSANDASQPQLAVFINGGSGVTLRNCVLSGFDYGVLMINTHGQRNHLVANTISARNRGIVLAGADNTEIAANAVTFTNPGGIGIVVTRNSGLNAATNNVVTFKFSSQADDPISWAASADYPGPIGPSNPAYDPTGSFGIWFGQLGNTSAIPTLINTVVNGVLYQVAIAPEPLAADNSIEGNTVGVALGAGLTSSTGVIGITSDQLLRTRITGNTVSGFRNGIRIKGDALLNPDSSSFQWQFPGTCTQNPNRLCLAQSDCDIAGVDPASQGTCNKGLKLFPDWTHHDGLVDGNTIVARGHGIQVVDAAADTVITNNAIDGAGTADGIALVGPWALGSTVVTGNRVTNAANALSFAVKDANGNRATAFTASVWRNSFTGYSAEVQTVNDYALPTELSAGGVGNYWGRGCSNQPFEPSLVTYANGRGADAPPITDGHPLGSFDSSVAVCR